MESLESKLDRLSIEQRKEIEDFVDFLLSRSRLAYNPPDATGSPHPVPGMAPPPLSLIEPVQAGDPLPVMWKDLTRTDDRSAPAAGDRSDPAAFQEIGGGSDRITHDYMDYGQFEHQHSPAAEAVKKVKRRLIARESQEKPRHLVDWVD